MLFARAGRIALISFVFAACAEPVDEPMTTTTPAVVAGCESATPAADARLTGVWIAPGGAAWVVGDDGLVGRRTGETWAWCRAGGGESFSAVWGAADEDVWITGEAGTILRWRGERFERIDAGTTADLAGIWGSSAQQVFVVGDAGVARHFDGTAWRTADVTADELGAVWGASASDVWIAGTRRYTTTTAGGFEKNTCEAELHRWDAATRTFTREHAFTQEHGACGILGLGGTSASDVWAVGIDVPAGAAAGFAFAAHRDGARWARVTPADEDLTIDRTYTDVAAGAPGAEDGAWVVATGVSSVRNSGGAWSGGDSATADLLDIDVRDSTMFAVGTGAKVLRWDGASWLRVH